MIAPFDRVAVLTRGQLARGRPAQGGRDRLPGQFEVARRNSGYVSRAFHSAACALAERWDTELPWPARTAGQGHEKQNNGRGRHPPQE